MEMKWWRLFFVNKVSSDFLSSLCEGTGLLEQKCRNELLASILKLIIRVPVVIVIVLCEKKLKFW